ncbi:pentatricopeptide repeat-containing protein At1g80880, mitochondrial isoform X2 [Malania oleifera]|uniref:pentatricopeptide repeat-containing protein At1g80880, mitochondrial isoform X2 n=1 Tax=Malania oleifera TaxID=397392 RepID=UPI0025AE1286|nr:pentatricopeptide repeat-containing protein At1g80880, mitochondrial isoform X2 [Malania oleifera]
MQALDGRWHFSPSQGGCSGRTLIASSDRIPRSVTIQYFSTQKPYDPLGFIEDPDDVHQLLEPGVLKLLEVAKKFPSEEEAMAFLDSSGVKPNRHLVCSAIWALRDEWKVAFLVFKWGEKCESSSEKARGMVIWVLGNHRKFSVAWGLIRGWHHSSVETQRAMLILMDRYAAANNPAKAIRTFHIMERLKVSPDVKTFYVLLNTLCKHGNIEEAEDCMLLNKKFFPLETEGFNIILNGWCSISIDIIEAKRIWREMSKCCIIPNATSYTHMISCFSKVGNLFDSLRLYDEMKKRGWVPGLEVYNALIYVLTRENCLKEALKLLERMKEMGFKPDSATYNSLICPLCEAKKQEEARTILARMIGENISPTIDTYHAFLEGATLEGTLEVLKRMRRAGCSPEGETFHLILANFFKSKQVDNALKIWVEMKQHVVVNSGHYAALVEGLAMCGQFDKAREFHAEMISKGFLDDPKFKTLLKAQG